MEFVDWLFRHTLRSVVFGIALLVLIAGYVAIGSGVPAVREFFELDELGFFNAWPLKMLMVLLVATLVTVTLQRIPFTRPRYGVWMVHTGIVTLIAGMGWYYGHKIEGAALLIQGRSTQHYYDRFERALYFQAGGFVTRVPLTSLPRFNSYSAEQGNEKYLDRPDLKNLSPVIGRPDAKGGTQVANAGEILGMRSLGFTVTGYWPYASIRHRVLSDPASDKSGFSFRLADPGETDPRDRLLSAAMPRFSKFTWGDLDVEHQIVADQAAVDAMVAAAKNLHGLSVTIGGTEQTLPVEVGESFTMGTSGYSIDIESFNPRWETIDHKIVPKLTIVIKTPTQTFRRMVLSGLDRPTDFKLGGAGVGPMGKRQTTLLDPAIVIRYTFNDPTKIYPVGGLGRVLFLSPGAASTSVTVLNIEANRPVIVQTFSQDHFDFDLRSPLTEEGTIMAFAGRSPPVEMTTLHIDRVSHIGGQQAYVEEIPKAMRNRDEGASGRHQVVRVRYDAIDKDGTAINGEVITPFSEHPRETPWQGGLLELPNSAAVAQIQLGNNWRPMPAVARLDKLEAVAYAGMDPAMAAIIRDYRSTITLTDPQTAKSITDTVYLNSPVFYDRNNWIFFQSQFDLQNQRWSILGVGNRPGTYVMTAGCVLIVFGIFYAFYLKPMIIKRMKRQAIESAKTRQVSSANAQLEHV